MYKKLFLILLVGILYVNIAYAEEGIFETYCRVQVDTWVENNQSRNNVTLFTNNSDGPPNYYWYNVQNLDTGLQTIRFIDQFNCAFTEEMNFSRMLNDYFLSCDGEPCREKWNTCKTSNQGLQNDNIDLQSDLSSCQGDSGNLSICTSEKQNLQNNIERLNEEKKDLQKESDQRFYYFIAGCLVVGGYYWYNNWQKKAKKSNVDKFGQADISEQKFESKEFEEYKKSHGG